MIPHVRSVGKVALAGHAGGMMAAAGAGMLALLPVLLLTVHVSFVDVFG